MASNICFYIGAIPFVFNLCSTLTSAHSRWAPLYWSEQCRNYLPETCIHPRSLFSITLRRHELYHGDASSILLSSGLFISAYVNPTYLWAWLSESFFFPEWLFECWNIDEYPQLLVRVLSLNKDSDVFWRWNRWVVYVQCWLFPSRSYLSSYDLCCFQWFFYIAAIVIWNVQTI